MPWYSGIIIIFLFLGCANNQPQIGKKTFDLEDEMIIQGVVAQDNNLSQAINIFDNLYKKTNKYIYLQREIKLYYTKKDYNKTISLVDIFLKKYPQKEYITLYKIYSYMEYNDLNTALKISQQFLAKHRSLDIYKLVAYIYIKKGDYNSAIVYLKSAYSISHDTDVLMQMGDIFFKYLKRPNEAISYYQTHIRLYGCEEAVCNKLAQIYRFLYDYDNLIETYKKLYEETRNFIYANKVIYLYIDNSQYNKAINFIKTYHLDKKYLVLVYKAQFDETHDYKIAYKLYKLTNNYFYFYQYSMNKFKSSKKNKQDIRNLIANLKLLIKQDPKAIYLNYYGYILIEYDINPMKGLKFVKQALKIEPSSKEYLDSLAWGYYKINKCKKAYEIISKVDIDNIDIKKHKKIIRRCYDITKNHSKNKR